SIYSFDADPASPTFGSTRTIPVGVAAVQVAVDTNFNKIVALSTNDPSVASHYGAGSTGVDTLTVIDGATETVQQSVSLVGLGVDGMGLALDLARGFVCVVGTSGFLRLNISDLSVQDAIVTTNIETGALAYDTAVALDPTTGSLFYDG